MNDTRWRDVLSSIESASRHFSLAVDIFGEDGIGGGDRRAYRDEMALMHAMQSGYTSFENALLGIMVMLGEEPPTGADWHKQLVDRAAQPIPGLRPAILPTAILPLLRRTRAFRHWATHGYGDPFDPSEASRAVEAAGSLVGALRPAFVAFAAAIDP